MSKECENIKLKSPQPTGKKRMGGWIILKCDSSALAIAGIRGRLSFARAVYLLFP